MPTSSMDLLIASSAMIVIVIGALYGMNTLAEPYIGVDGLDWERCRQIERFMLLSQGKPTDWGAGGIPASLGFASNGRFYELDVDKVTRLNPLNAHALSYSQLWETLGIADVAFRIRIELLFDLTLTLTSANPQVENTTYTFAASTFRDGFPIPTDTKYYLAIGNFTDSKTCTTGHEGSGTVEFTLPNSLNGTAILVGMARAETSLTTFKLLSFAHNSASPTPGGTFAVLSPLNYTLDVVLAQGATVEGAYAFSFDYNCSLSLSGDSYVIPRLLDPSPLVLVLTGTNGSGRWGEWSTYPQVPLETGVDTNSSHWTSDVTAVSYLVEIRGVIYRYEVEFTRVA